MTSKVQKRPAPITTQWSNTSMSSIHSEANTFHSAHAWTPFTPHTGFESKYTPLSSLTSTPRTILRPEDTSSSKPDDSVKMDRQDSGFADDKPTSPISRRTSIYSDSASTTTSSTRRPKSSKRKSHTRPSSKRASRSTPYSTRSSVSSIRPPLSSRHTAPNTSKIVISKQQYPIEYFHFPSFPLAPSEPTAETKVEPLPPPPPPTVHYWTSDSTRRLEYAAIDAASKGFRGFLMKVIPECFLGGGRRVGFHSEERAKKGDWDAGSVRRYRLELEDGEEQEDRKKGLEELKKRISGSLRKKSKS
ncbi:hypothetical protein B7494_g3893 [Chlorociboria aeruginascens]|nr:hypothetical protein B7494_g3893 [Chlorociboria aeruginascens]